MLRPAARIAGLTKHFGATVALDNVDFDVAFGEIHAVVGENGAGKSTLMNVASGATAPDEGTILFEGTPVGPLTPAVAQDLGVAIVHQHPALLPDLYRL